MKILNWVFALALSAIGICGLYTGKHEAIPVFLTALTVAICIINSERILNLITKNDEFLFPETYIYQSKFTILDIYKFIESCIKASSPITVLLIIKANTHISISNISYQIILFFVYLVSQIAIVRECYVLVHKRMSFKMFIFSMLLGILPFILLTVQIS